MKVSFNGYKEGIVTFETASGVAVGDFVMVSDNGKVQKAASSFCGICTGLRNGYAAVQLDGYAKVPYTGNLSVGYNKLAVSDDALTVSQSGRELLVVDVDSVSGYAGIIL